MEHHLIAKTDDDTILFHFPGYHSGATFFNIPITLLEEQATPERIADLQKQFKAADRFLKRYGRILKWLHRYDRVLNHRVNLQMEILISVIYLQEFKHHES